MSVELEAQAWRELEFAAHSTGEIEVAMVSLPIEKVRALVAGRNTPETPALEVAAFIHSMGDIWRADNCPNYDFSTDGWRGLVYQDQASRIIADNDARIVGSDAVIETQADSIDKLERRVQHWQDRHATLEANLAAKDARIAELEETVRDDTSFGRRQVARAETAEAKVKERGVEIAGLRNSYWQERKARLEAEAKVAELEAQIGAIMGHNTAPLTAADHAYITAHLSWELEPEGKQPSWNQLAMEIVRQSAKIETAEAALKAAQDAARSAHDTLIEINPSNYDHDDVCRMNDASVEAIFLLADVVGETHGKTAEWWAERRAALATGEQ